jgi:hypothetical protein
MLCRLLAGLPGQQLCLDWLHAMRSAARIKMTCLQHNVLSGLAWQLEGAKEDFVQQ